MKKNKGITMVALVITIVLLLILAGISIGTGGNIIKRTELENLKTGMLLIEVKGKEYVENANFNLGTGFEKLTDETEKSKRKTEDFSWICSGFRKNICDAGSCAWSKKTSGGCGSGIYRTPCPSGHTGNDRGAGSNSAPYGGLQGNSASRV